VLTLAGAGVEHLGEARVGRIDRGLLVAVDAVDQRADQRVERGGVRRIGAVGRSGRPGIIVVSHGFSIPWWG